MSSTTSNHVRDPGGESVRQFLELSHPGQFWPQVIPQGCFFHSFKKNPLIRRAFSSGRSVGYSPAGASALRIAASSLLPFFQYQPC